MQKLTVVPASAPDAAEKLRRRIAHHPKPADLLQCRCGGRELIQVKSGMSFRDGQASGGTKQYLCALCLMRGERVVVA